jgi:hypothetical protein
MTDAGIPPVEPTSAGGEGGALSLTSGCSGGDGVGCTTESGIPPDEPKTGGETTDGVCIGIGGGGVYVEDENCGLGIPVPSSSGLEDTVTMVASDVNVVRPAAVLLARSVVESSDDEREDEDDSKDDEEDSSGFAPDCDSNRDERDSQKDDRSAEDCRDSMSELLLLLEGEDDEEVVDEAGAVALAVTIWRFTWRGK